jgi:hydrogenase nickel incorporation protein HypA/HybF
VHELSVCQALLTQVAEIAGARGAQRVGKITIEVGPLSGIDATLLANAFAIARSGTCASQATLWVEARAVEIACLTCGARSRTLPNRLVCHTCGGYRTRIVAGDELRLRQVELHLPPQASPETGDV